MTHRVDQILDSIVGLIPSDDQRVFKHRRRSLAADAQELPAISVDLGEEAPLDDDGASNLVFLDSLVQVEVTCLARHAEEPSLIAELIRMRTAVHKALMSGNRDLGLQFVIDVRYGASSAPDIDTESEELSGSYTSRWLVHYRMNITDPE